MKNIDIGLKSLLGRALPVPLSNQLVALGYQKLSFHDGPHFSRQDAPLTRATSIRV